VRVQFCVRAVDPAFGCAWMQSRIYGVVRVWNYVCMEFYVHGVVQLILPLLHQALLVTYFLVGVVFVVVVVVVVVAVGVGVVAVVVVIVVFVVVVVVVAVCFRCCGCCRCCRRCR